MKQKLALIPVLLLFGCSRITDDIQTRLNDKLADAAETEINYTNYSKNYYSYYLQPSVGRMDADQTSNTFELDGNKFVMNLNIVSVISEKKGSGILLGKDAIDASQTIASSEGTYTDAEGTELPYEIRICSAGRTDAVIMHTAYFDFCGFCDANKAPEMAAEMMRIARSARVNPDAILSEYAYDEAISYTGKAVKLFEDIAPESGTIEDLFVDSGTAGTGVGEYTDDSQEYYTQIETDEAPEEDSESASEE